MLDSKNELQKKERGSLMEVCSKLDFEECCKIPVEQKFSIMFAFVQIGVLKPYGDDSKELTATDIRKSYDSGNSEVRYALQCGFGNLFNRCVKEEIITVNESTLEFEKAADVLSKMYKPDKVFVSAFSEGNPFFVAVDSDNSKLDVMMLV